MPKDSIYFVDFRLSTSFITMAPIRNRRGKRNNLKLKLNLTEEITIRNNCNFDSLPIRGPKEVRNPCRSRYAPMTRAEKKYQDRQNRDFYCSTDASYWGIYYRNSHPLKGVTYRSHVMFGIKKFIPDMSPKNAIDYNRWVDVSSDLNHLEDDDFLELEGQYAAGIIKTSDLSKYALQ